MVTQPIRKFLYLFFIHIMQIIFFYFSVKRPTVIFTNSIRLEYFVPNTTSRCQPTDQGMVDDFLYNERSL